MSQVIDADLHNMVPGMEALHRYLPAHWREYFANSRFQGPIDTSYPAWAPSSRRRDLPPEAATTLADVQRNALDPCGTIVGILNCTYEVDSLHNPDMAAAMARAVNEWQAAEWLSRDSRMRASIVLPSKVPALSVAEIDHWGNHPGFVQILLPARSAQPYGSRNFWPIFESAVRHNLVVCIHFGGSPGVPGTPTGWPSHYIEEYAGMAQVFQSQVISLIAEGTFAQFPSLRVVLAEGGWTWLPALMWRLDKEWRGLRFEIPWVKESPSSLIRRHMRFTVQPIDAPPTVEQLAQTLAQLENDDLLLFSTDYPHAHSPDGPAAMLSSLSNGLRRKIMSGNARAFYGF